MVWDLGRHAFPQLSATGREYLAYVAALATTLLFFASVLLHELSHSFVARRMGIGVSRITLFIFGGVAQVDEEPRTPRQELLISIAGPAMSVLLAAVFGAVAMLLRNRWGTTIPGLCLERVAQVNLVLAIFNMVPGFPLDGGRILRSLLWMGWSDRVRSTRVASVFGQMVGYALAGIGVLQGVALASPWLGIFYVGMGLLLASVARGTYRRELVQAALDATPVWHFAVPPELSFPLGTPLSYAAPYLLARGGGMPVPVLLDSQPVGILSRDPVAAIPPWQWTQLRVEDVMDTLREEMVLRTSQSASAALDRMQRENRSSLMLVDQWGNFGGIVTAASLHAALASMQG